MIRQSPSSTLFPYTTLFRSWFIVFDTLTLADDRLEAFYDNPNALRDYFRKTPLIGRQRSEERFSRNAETDIVCRLLLEKKKLGTARDSLFYLVQRIDIHDLRT